MEKPIIETITTLPPLAATIIAVCVAVAVACLGIWLAAPAVLNIIRLSRRTLASEYKLQHLRTQYDRAALNYWIRDSYRNKRLAAIAEKDLNQAAGRADQERSLRHQVAKTGDAMIRRKEMAHAD